jgi:hypothetical protein
MTRPYTLKVNRHVSYRRATGRWVPAVVTAVVDATHCTVRVVHGGETHANIARKSAVSDTNVWQSY